MQILFNSLAADGRGGWFIHLSKIWDLEPYFRDSGDSEVCVQGALNFVRSFLFSRVQAQKKKTH